MKAAGQREKQSGIPPSPSSAVIRKIVLYWGDSPVWLNISRKSGAYGGF
jgi:hypothetical protein